MYIQILRAKLHRATVTNHDLNYEGSLTIASDLMELAGFHPYEKIAVWNVTNGNRFETYVLEGRPYSGEICVNGAAAHLAKKGDVLIVAAHAIVPMPAANERVEMEPRVVRLDAENRPLANTGPERAS